MSDLPASSFLVEVSPGAGIDGELIEGDVLVADEKRITEYGDLVLACDEYDEMRAYRSHRIGGYLRLVPMGGGHAVPASALDCVGVVVRRARNPANDFEPEEIADTTLADAFAPWFSVSTWNTSSPADARRFHECCHDYMQSSGGQVRAGAFVETLRKAISQRCGGSWDDYCERALQSRAQCAEAICAYLHDTHQITR
ncbi:hypothetical protein F0A16_16430 [Salinicola corii]|uniref:Uncharacterized protein n=1 Tax=Salinicola corii TaxID=2606937 RepID=A0A640WBA0_9GAMM|nr:hypothetical protein [Salinicola corii]KAA0016662.1 hypothetical protein F0A16_16430 [Salinicola corii]